MLAVAVMALVALAALRPNVVAVGNALARSRLREGVNQLETAPLDMPARQ